MLRGGEQPLKACDCPTLHMCAVSTFSDLSALVPSETDGRSRSAECWTNLPLSLAGSGSRLELVSEGKREVDEMVRSSSERQNEVLSAP
jgi:hypothetical protein